MFARARARGLLCALVGRRLPSRPSSAATRPRSISGTHGIAAVAIIMVVVVVVVAGVCRCCYCCCCCRRCRCRWLSPPLLVLLQRWSSCSSGPRVCFRRLVCVCVTPVLFFFFIVCSSRCVLNMHGTWVVGTPTSTGCTGALLETSYGALGRRRWRRRRRRQQ